MIEYTQILAILEEHLLVTAWDGPGRCRGCDWESRAIGISSHIQHRQHVARMLANECRIFEQAALDQGWDEAVEALYVEGAIGGAGLDLYMGARHQYKKGGTE